MAVVDNKKASTTLGYWKASLAWKNIGNWAAGWTQESFIQECRSLCCDQGNVGKKADDLLDDMINGIERRALHEGIVVELHKTEKVSQQA